MKYFKYVFEFSKPQYCFDELVKSSIIISGSKEAAIAILKTAYPDVGDTEVNLVSSEPSTVFSDAPKMASEGNINHTLLSGDLGAGDLGDV